MRQAQSSLGVPDSILLSEAAFRKGSGVSGWLKRCMFLLNGTEMGDGMAL